MPPRPPGAIGGAEFAKKVAKLSLKDREAAILREITSGNFPEFLRNFKTVEIRGPLKPVTNEPEVTATIEVMPDYLAIGSDADFVRMPMTPQTAQQIADRFGCVLPTRKMVDAIDAQAELKLAPHPMTEAREAVATFAEHHQIIEQQRGDKPLGLLITGIKKDIVLTPRIFEKPQRLAIYGWRQLERPADPAAYDRALESLRRLQPRRAAGARYARRSTASNENRRAAGRPQPLRPGQRRRPDAAAAVSGWSKIR